MSIIDALLQLFGFRPLTEEPTATPEVKAGRDAWRRVGPGASLLFLDFDGVIHRAENGSFERLPELRAILAAAPNAHVVISSNWRANTSRDYLLGLFPMDLRDRIVGVTPDLSSVGGSREDEINAFAHIAGASVVVALDDDSTLFSPGCPFLVKTDRHTGIDDATVAECIRRLAQDRARRF